MCVSFRIRALTRRHLILGAHRVLFAGVVWLTLTMIVSAASKPNIVFIMIDDLGWMDLACQGNRLVETPNVDQLAAEGVRFTDNYAAAPVCSPTRASIMTGRAPARLRITNHLPDQKRFVPDDAKLLPAECRDHLPLEEVTIAERLRQAGYATAFIGKWHLSQRGNTTFHPEHQGFDRNIGGCDFGGPPTFFDPYRIPTIENRKQGEYLPDRLADESIRFMTEHVQSQQASDRKRPFYLCLWNYTVHWPMEAPAELLEKYKDRTGPGLNDTRYGAMIEAMDTATGRVLEAIDDLGVREDTLVIFTSDNGAFGGVGDNRPLRKEKGYLYEGGVRVPLIVRWPGRTQAGRVCDTPTISTDFYPTLLEAAGIKLQEVDERDGRSLVGLFEGQELNREAIYFHYPNYAFHRGNRPGSAIRCGHYKLIDFYGDEAAELYDLKNDISESKNLASEQPNVVTQLRAKLAAWRTETNAASPVEVD